MRKSPKPNARVMALLLILPLSLTACASLTNFRATEPAPPSQTTRVACESFAPITWSKADTDETIAQIKAHNAAWVELCRKG